MNFFHLNNKIIRNQKISILQLANFVKLRIFLPFLSKSNLSRLKSLPAHSISRTPEIFYNTPQTADPISG